MGQKKRSEDRDLDESAATEAVGAETDLEDQERAEPEVGTVESEVEGEVPDAKGESDEDEPDLEAQLQEVKDRYLRTLAEYDNYRKRTARQFAEFADRARGEVIGKLLDSLDDLGRVAHLDPENTKVADVLEGVDLVERNMFKELNALGMEQVGIEGEAFDPNFHEAVGTLPAESEDQHNTVGAVLQSGYRLGSVLIRPARVQVYM